MGFHVGWSGPGKGGVAAVRRVLRAWPCEGVVLGGLALEPGGRFRMLLDVANGMLGVGPYQKTRLEVNLVLWRNWVSRASKFWEAPFFSPLLQGTQPSMA